MIKLKNHKKLVEAVGLEAAGILLLFLEKAKKKNEVGLELFVSFEYSIEELMKDSCLAPDDIERLIEKLADKDFFYKGKHYYHLHIVTIFEFLYKPKDFLEML